MTKGANHAGTLQSKLRKKPAVSTRNGVNTLTKEECVLKQS